MLLFHFARLFLISALYNDQIANIYGNTSRKRKQVVMYIFLCFRETAGRRVAVFREYVFLEEIAFLVISWRIRILEDLVPNMLYINRKFSACRNRIVNRITKLNSLEAKPSFFYFLSSLKREGKGEISFRGFSPRNYPQFNCP